MTTVTIDGAEYVPRSTVVSEAALKALAEAYRIAYCEGKYDPYHHCPCVDAMSRVWALLRDSNKELGFKK